MEISQIFCRNNIRKEVNVTIDWMIFDCGSHIIDFTELKSEGVPYGSKRLEWTHLYRSHQIIITVALLNHTKSWVNVQVYLMSEWTRWETCRAIWLRDVPRCCRVASTTDNCYAAIIHFVRKISRDALPHRIRISAALAFYAWKPFGFGFVVSPPLFILPFATLPTLLGCFSTG